jgi:hypothetical protein
MRLVSRVVRGRSGFCGQTDHAAAIAIGFTPTVQGRRLIMSLAPDDHRRKLLTAAFQMPSVQTMVSRKSSITNAFVSAIIPVIVPTHDEIEEALHILGMEPHDVRCAYCGDKASEWDHLRPLVLDRRPTGYVSEIANLVPSCGKCNQSKGNKPWRDWVVGSARLSPTGRGIEGVSARVARLEEFERWRKPTRVDFESVLGRDGWEHYWSLCEAVIEQLKQCQKVADDLRAKIGGSLGQRQPPIV